MSRKATISLDDALRQAWDVVVIGAGPAGAMAAIELARHNRNTLLVDGKRFPRGKVCGGCLNARSRAALEQAQLSHLLDDCGAPELDSVRFVTRGRSATFATPAGAAVSRAAFDAKLVEAAVAAGARFLPETHALVEACVADDRRSVQLSQGSRRERTSARVVICADGLLRSSLKQLPEFHARVSPDSRLGVGALLENAGGDVEERADAEAYPAGRVVMAVARRGYVGLTRVEQGRLNVAAALDAGVLHDGRSIFEVVSGLLGEAGLPVPDGLERADWSGTPPLTSSAGRAAGERLFVVGDAAGYVEPFTGEGIAWALEGGQAVAPLAAEACTAWRTELAERWETLHRSNRRRTQATCRAMAWILRRPWSTQAAMTVCRVFPWAIRRVISRINRAPRERDTLAVNAP